MNQYCLETKVPNYFLIIGWSAPNKCFYAAKVHQTWWINPETSTNIETFAALEDELSFIKMHANIPQQLRNHLLNDRAQPLHSYYRAEKLVIYRYQRDGALTVCNSGGFEYE